MASILLRCELCWTLLFVLMVARGQSDVGFDFFVLVRQWGPTFCESRSCRNDPVAKFTLHGFWPNYASGGWPSFCNPSDRFSTANLPQPLLSQMECEWRSYTGASEDFWFYQYDKHGTCAAPLFITQEAYFNATIDLNNQFEPNDALVEAGIDPEDIGTIPVSELQDALEDAWGVRPVISCNSDSLFEVWMCVDLDLRAIQCPGSVRARPCPSSVGMPEGASVPPVCSKYFTATETSSSSSSPSSSGGGSIIGTGTGSTVASTSAASLSTASLLAAPAIALLGGVVFMA